MRHPKNLLELYSGSDLDQLFKGNFINFGYWLNEGQTEILTENDVIEANKQLYSQVFQRLSLEENDRVLEAGCGHGAGIALLLERYTIQSLTGLDCLSTHIARCKRTNARSLQEEKINFVNKPIEATDFPDNSFDKIYTIEAFQHFSTQAALAELARILSPDGKLVISTFFAKDTPSFKELMTLLPRTALLADQGNENLAALPQVVDLLKYYNFRNLTIEKIGDSVWFAYDKWVKQNNPSIWDSNWLIAYQKELLDYYIITAYLN